VLLGLLGGVVEVDVGGGPVIARQFTLTVEKIVALPINHFVEMLLRFRNLFFSSSPIDTLVDPNHDEVAI